MRSHQQAPRRLKRLVYLRVYAVGARHQRERHIAHRGDAHGAQTPEVVTVDVTELRRREAREHLGHIDHACGLTQDARQVAVGVTVKAATCWRLGVLGDAQRAEARRVGPQRVRIARVHSDGTVGKSRIQRGTCRHD